MLSKFLLSLLLFGVAYAGDSTDTNEDASESRDTESDDTDIVTCYDKLECSGDDIEADYVDCGGYYGCYEADISCEITAYLDGIRGAQEADVSANEDIYCGGYVSCFMSEAVSQGDVICDGAVGCYNSIVYSSNDIYLVGYKAATATDLFGNSSDVSIYAFGAYSALYSIINDVENIYNYGLYGLYFADIFTDGMDGDEFNLVSYGRLGTYYAQLYCKHGTTCNVDCRDYGCYGFEIRCYRGATCTYTVNDEDCDSEPTILYAKGYSDEQEFDQLFEERKKMKTLAKQEFKNKYHIDLDKLMNEATTDEQREKLFKEYDLENKFEQVMEDVKERMGLMEGKPDHFEKRDEMRRISPMNSDNKKLNSGNVIHVSQVDKNGFDFEAGSAGYGLLAGFAVFALGAAVFKFCGKNAVNSLIDSKQYKYESI